MPPRTPWARGDYQDEVEEVRPNEEVAGVSIDTGKYAATRSAGQIPMLISSASDKGVKRFMEDVPVHIDRLNDSGDPGLDFAVHGVIDGHGGREVADFLASNLRRLMQRGLAEALPSLYPGGDIVDKQEFVTIIGEMVVATFEQIDTQIAIQVPSCIKEGCTVAVVLLPINCPYNLVFSVNVGDSQVYLCRYGDISTGLAGPLSETEKSGESGKLHSIELSMIHKPWNAEEKNRILAHEGMIQKGRVNGILDVSRSVGDVNFRRHGVVSVPSVSFVDWNNDRDRMILLGTDGVFTNSEPLKLHERIDKLVITETKKAVLENKIENSRGMSSYVLDKVCKDMLSFILQSNQDNVTLVLIANASRDVI